MTKKKILIVEDDNFARYTLKYEFKNNPDIEVLDAVKNGKEAFDFVKKCEPDIILMDIEMPIMNGIEATKNIKEYNPDIKIIMLTSHKERDCVLWAFSAGANGYCVKNIKTPELINIMDIISDNGVWFDKQIAQFVFEIMQGAANLTENPYKPTDKVKELNITPRERNIIKLISDGLNNAQIAEELVISKNTVKIHVSSIIKKLAVEDRTQVALFAIKNDIL